MDLSDEGAYVLEAERIKLDMKRKVPKRNLVSIWSEITNTNVGKWDYEEFKARMSVENPSLLTSRLVNSKFAHVDCFRPIVQCYELVLECRRHYDLGT